MGRVIKVVNALMGKEEKPKRRKGTPEDPVRPDVVYVQPAPSDNGNGHHSEDLDQIKTAIKHLAERQANQELIGSEGRISIAKMMVITPPEAKREMAVISRRMSCILPVYEVIHYAKVDKARRPIHPDGTPLTLREIWLDRSLSYSRSVQGRHLGKVSDLAGLQSENDEDGPSSGKPYVGR